MPATISEKAKLAKNSGAVTPASMAPGMTSMIALSTISISVMEAVSEAKASGRAVPNARPLLTSGSNVSA